MSKRNALITFLLVALIIGIAAWSRLRYVDQEGYDEPQRVRADEHPAFRRQDGMSG